MGKGNEDWSCRGSMEEEKKKRSKKINNNNNNNININNNNNNNNNNNKNMNYNRVMYFMTGFNSGINTILIAIFSRNW